MLIGLGSLAYSQLADDSSDESPPLVPGSALPPLPGEAEDASVGEGSDAPVKNLREDFATARRALARARQARSESDRRSKAELDRMRKDLERSKEELRLAQRAFSVGDPNRATKLSSLQDQVDKALVKLKAREQGLSREEAFAARKLQSLEEELGASEAILADALAEVATPGEALPAVSLLQENLNHTHNDIVSSLNDSARNEQDVLAVAQGLGSTLEAARQELAAVREIALREGRSKELETVDPSGSPESELKTVTDFQLEESARLRPEIGELDITRPPSNDTIRQLQEKVDASEGLQASLNEDVEKLRTELKQAFRKIISMQMKLEESDLLVNDLERQKNSLMQSKKEGVSGVEGMNRMMERLEKELATAKTELSQAHDSLNAEKVKSAAVISNQTAELQRTKMELERVKVLAKVEGRDATSMLKLEEELNRTKAQLLTLQRQNIESGAGTADIKAELKSAFGEIMKLKAELAGKEDLKQQLANLEKSLAGNDVANASPERLNELIRNLNASKLALQQARADQENVRSTLSIQVAGLEDELQQSHDALDRAKADITRKELDFSSLVKRLEKIQQAQENQKNVRRSLSEVVAGLEDELQQSRDNLDLAQVEMARKELEFSDLVKGLESELAGTYKVIRQTTNAHTQGSDVIEIMDADLGAAQTRMQQITDVMEKERLDAAKHIRDLQLELQTVRLRQESILDEVREKDQNIAAKDDKLQRVVGRNAKLEEQLKEVEAMSHTLTELNSVLRSTETVQNSNVDQANALVNHLRDELEQAKVEALLAKQSKGDLERRSEVRVNALEKQLNDTQNQLELVKGQFHDMTGEGAALIAELRGNLRQAEAEITLLKQAGAGETVGTEKLAAQLQEALGAIQVLQHNLNESEKVNAEVDDLRLRLATAMEANIGEKERDEAETVVLRKKMRTLEMELAMAQQAQSEVRVTGNQLFSNLKDELEASRAKVAAMQARLGQSEDSSVGTIADLEEQLARSKAEKMEIEQRMHNLLQGKTQSVDALEQQLVLTKKRIDELEQLTQGAEPNQTRITSLEQQLVATKAQLDDLNEQRNAGEVGSIRAAELEKQLTNTQNRLNELLVAAQQEKPGHPPSSAVVAQLQTQLNDARSALDLLQGTLIQRDKENNEIEAELEKALENMMDMQMSAGGGNLRRELDALKKQLAEAKAIGPSPAPVDSTAMAALELEISKLKSQLEQARQNQVADQTAAMAALELEITKLKSELEQARQNQAVDQTADLATLQLEIDQLKKDLQQAAQGNSTSSGTAAVRLKGELETATETIVDLQTQLAASKKQLQ
ncbi:MAG: hypothetical protein CMI32_04645, partial [Opitutales bacterium]|nr:hypothetical protein [Opitutales bacterium]